MLKTFVKSVKIYLPSFLQKKIEKKAQHNKLEKHKKRKKRVFVKLETIEDLLNKFDFNSDILIHSSTSNIGKIEGGSKVITDLIISKMNLSTHTLLAPALPFLGSMEDYLGTCNSFDLKKAKNSMGNISNMIMKKDNCYRSLHPTHSVIAIGKDAKNYTMEHELCDTPFCTKSPYYKITKNGGKILMFGVNLNSVTNFHVYEDMLGDFLPFNIYTKDVYTVHAMGNGKECEISVKAHNPLLSAKRDCERARKYLIENHYINTFTLGDSEISLLDAKGITITLFEMLLQGDSIYGKVKLSKEQKLKIKDFLEELK